MAKDFGYSKKRTWDKYTAKEMKTVFDYAEGYKKFLHFSKTERRAVTYLTEMAKKKKYSEKGTEKYLMINRGKNLALVSAGKKSPLEGIKFVGSHIDSPRIDLKQNPLYEKEELAMMKTHYYGGIRKYQWLSRPLAMYGVIIDSKGKQIEISVGDETGDPVFVISDLLPHLASAQMGKSVREAFEGEKLNIIVGSMPEKGKEKNPIKENILSLLNKKYSITEEDFISAELEIVPAGSVSDVGFDRSLIGGYGHDDRICAYASATAIFESDNLFCTCAVMFDKEEIGSDGSTGAKSRFLEDIVIEILSKSGIKPTYENIRKTMKKSEFLSSDVNAGIDPDFQDVHEAMNAAKMGFGVVITKFTGSYGKSSANDADAEFVGKVRRILNDYGVIWQTAELGKVDVGGGGTIASYIAQYGVHVIDCGPALLGMHSPFELVSKGDLYETYKAYRAFFESKY